MAGRRHWADVTLEELRATRARPAPETGALNDVASVLAKELRRPPLPPGVFAACAAIIDLAAVAVLIWFGQFIVVVAPFDAAAVTLRAIALSVGIVAVLGLTGSYGLREMRDVFAAWGRAVIAATIAIAVAIAMGFWTDAGPTLFSLLVLLTALLFLPLRFAAATAASWLLDAGVTERRAIIVGGGRNAEALIRGLESRPRGDIRIVGFFDDRDDLRSPPVVAGRHKLGTISDLIEFARVAHVDMLIVTLPLSAEERILALLKSLWVLPLDIRLSCYSADFDFRRRGGGGDGALIDVLRSPMPAGARALKRCLDLGLASLALVAFAPLMLVTALAIKLDSPGPVFFRQARHGYNHRPIQIWKFRSMRQETADPEGLRVVTRDDDRVTHVGRFIRKTSIDELPQLFNVLAGELSLVGPRPHALKGMSSRQQLFSEIVEGYSGRHRVPPGITGWAQVNGWRGEVDDPEELRQRFEHDLYYIENWSIWFDLKILLMTPVRLFDTRHAY
jgi:Undecaprenyl-phosphate glucose phosphotransferase